LAAPARGTASPFSCAGVGHGYRRGVTRIVEGAGVPLAVLYESAENGPATVLVHGMGGTMWPLDALPGRVISYDRRGYGESGSPAPYVQTTVNEHAEDLACVLRATGAAPALLAGADFGALVVLDILLRRPELARAAVLVDPPVYMFVAEATEALSEERRRLEDELRAGGPEVLERERGRVADFGAIASLPLTHGGLAAIAAPVAIVSSPRALPHDLAAAEALLDAMPTAVGARDLADGLRRVEG
jgi:pimeloyl-ACP methyl ester carboxylesterase